MLKGLISVQKADTVIILWCWTITCRISVPCPQKILLHNTHHFTPTCIVLYLQVTVIKLCMPCVMHAPSCTCTHHVTHTHTLTLSYTHPLSHPHILSYPHFQFCMHTPCQCHSPTVTPHPHNTATPKHIHAQCCTHSALTNIFKYHMHCACTCGLIHLHHVTLPRPYLHTYILHPPTHTECHTHPAIHSLLQ